MRLFAIYGILALSASLQVDPANADPFAVRNYQQGMSIEQVGRLAREQGHTLLLDRVGEGSITVQQGGKDIAYLGFCHDSLSSASYLVHGGFETFIKLLDSLTRQGLQAADVRWESSPGPDGRERFNMTISFSPPGPNNGYRVIAALFGCEGYGVMSSLVTWRAGSGECKE
jgi:hypothetical protein